MATRIVVFPVAGRRWAYNALAPSGTAGKASEADTFGQLWQRLLSSTQFSDRAVLLEKISSNKMHEKWTALGAAPSGSVRQRIHSIGQKLLARLQPSEQFLKSIQNDTSSVELVFPESLNPRLVRRRVRHLAISGSVLHRKYMYGSIALLPFSALLSILPLPNFMLFWNLFRAHAHWRALQGSTRLQLLVTDSEARELITEHDSQEIHQSKHGHDHTGEKASLEKKESDSQPSAPLGPCAFCKTG